MNANVVDLRQLTAIKTITPRAAVKGTVLAFLLCFVAACSRQVQPPAATEPPPSPPPAVFYDFSQIDAAVDRELSAGHVPGAVVLVGHKGAILYRKAFGSRAIEPALEAMTEDTIFDIASLTKVVATTTAIMQLVDEGRLRLDDPAALYWPEFSRNGKGQITLRQLLTHSSGLRADVNPKVRWSGYDGALSVIVDDRPAVAPETGFRYSDVNFIALGEIVRRVSGLPLDKFCSQRIFEPLGMGDTAFRPARRELSRIAPSDLQNGVLRRGQVHDPTAYHMGGIAGHAGVFSTADDLAVFAQMLISGGLHKGRRILGAEAVAAMTSPHSISKDAVIRGLGWDMRSPYSKEHNLSFPGGSFGHTGYTGSSMWIDPRSKTSLIILTNRLHPNGKGQVKPLRTQVAAAMASVLPMGPPAGVSGAGLPTEDVMAAGSGQSDRPDHVRPGIDVLASRGFAPLTGRTIGLITNQTALDAAGKSTVDLLLRAPRVKLGALFSPEHGLAGNRDEKISSGKDPATGLPVYSLYGEVKRPAPEMLRGLDALVYDIQDVGVRYYTYITTMAYCMEAAAAAGLDFFVLDRPNPVTASRVQGPLMDPDLKSFIGYFPLPVRYGMTPGELAQLFNRESRIGARLHVVSMEGYRRGMWFDETGLAWVDPSPNIRSLAQATLYSGVAIVESANVSVGRGTPTPFEVLGAPWISGDHLARYLSARGIPGISFEPAVFTPKGHRFRDQRCEGVRMHLKDRNAFDGPILGVELASALHRLYPGKFQVDLVLNMIGSREVLRGIKKGDDPREIRRGWEAGLEAFMGLRGKYLLY